MSHISSYRDSGRPISHRQRALLSGDSDIQEWVEKEIKLSEN